MVIVRFMRLPTLSRRNNSHHGPTRTVTNTGYSRRTVALASSEDGPGWPYFNPAIAQRDVMRRYYLSTSSQEMLEIVTTSTESLDVNTTLDLLCHTADMRLKGQLEDDAHPLVEALVGELAASIPVMKPVHLGSLLWGVATVGCSSQVGEHLVRQVAALELGAARTASYNTKEVCSIIHALGKLSGRAHPQVCTYTSALVEELVQRMRTLPYVRAALSAGDCAELAAGAAAIFTPAGPPQPGGAPPPAAVPLLLDELAAEVKRQLANKHSLGVVLNPREVLVLVGSYAQLGHRSPSVSGLLDSVAGFVARRIRERHVNAVRRPCDLSRLLAAFAALGHNSVAMPELLAAVNQQVCLNAAQQQELQGGSTQQGGPLGDLPPPASAAGSAQQLQASDGGRSSSSMAGSAPLSDTSFPLAHVNLLLESYAALGYAPSWVVLQALMPDCRRQLHCAPHDEVLRLLRLLVLVGFHPGHTLLQAMLARLGEEGGKACRDQPNSWWQSLRVNVVNEGHGWWNHLSPCVVGGQVMWT